MGWPTQGGAVRGGHVCSMRWPAFQSGRREAAAAVRYGRSGTPPRFMAAIFRSHPGPRVSRKYVSLRTAGVALPRCAWLRMAPARPHSRMLIEWYDSTRPCSPLSCSSVSRRGVAGRGGYPLHNVPASSPFREAPDDPAPPRAALATGTAAQMAADGGRPSPGRPALPERIVARGLAAEGRGWKRLGSGRRQSPCSCKETAFIRVGLGHHHRARQAAPSAAV